MLTGRIGRSACSFGATASFSIAAHARFERLSRSWRSLVASRCASTRSGRRGSGAGRTGKQKERLRGARRAFAALGSHRRRGWIRRLAKARSEAAADRYRAAPARSDVASAGPAPGGGTTDRDRPTSAGRRYHRRERTGRGIGPPEHPRQTGGRGIGDGGETRASRKTGSRSAEAETQSAGRRSRAGRKNRKTRREAREKEEHQARPGRRQSVLSLLRFEKWKRHFLTTPGREISPLAREGEGATRG